MTAPTPQRPILIVVRRRRSDAKTERSPSTLRRERTASSRRAAAARQRDGDARPRGGGDRARRRAPARASAASRCCSIVRENYPLVEVIMISADEPTSRRPCRPSSTAPTTSSPRTSTTRRCAPCVRNAGEHQDLNRQVLTLERAGRRSRTASSSSARAGAMRDVVELVAASREALGDGADPRRERHGQGAAGAADPPRGRAPDGAVRRREPGRDSARAGREHAVRPREGRVHRRASASSSASSSWRPAARCSSTRSATCGSTCRPSCCARSRRARSSASAARSRSDRVPAHRGHQRRPRAGGEGGALPRGPLLPAQRHPDPAAAAPRAHRGPAGAGAVLPAALHARGSASRSTASPTRR